MKYCLYNVTTAIKIGGIETYFWEIAKELRLQGEDVELISGIGSMIRYPELRIRQFSFTPRNKIVNLGNRFRKLGERISFFIHAYPYLKKQDYDIFLVHKPMDFFAAWLMKRANPDLLTVFVSGGEDFYGFDRFFSASLDLMVSVSNDNAAKIKDRYGRSVVVIPNGVDTKKFSYASSKREEIRNRYNLENKKVLISVGRIVGWKGFQLVIEALKIMPEWHYLLLGDGGYLDELKQLAEKNMVADRVVFAGEISNSVLPDYLSAGDIFVQPSIGHEAFGITLLEAMSCGLPVVASRNGGMKDIVMDGTNGYLFETGNIDDMKKAIEKTFLHKADMTPRVFVEERYT